MGSRNYFSVWKQRIIHDLLWSNHLWRCLPDLVTANSQRDEEKKCRTYCLSQFNFFKKINRRFWAQMKNTNRPYSWSPFINKLFIDWIIYLFIFIFFHVLQVTFASASTNNNISSRSTKKCSLNFRRGENRPKRFFPPVE